MGVRVSCLLRVMVWSDGNRGWNTADFDGMGLMIGLRRRAMGGICGRSQKAVVGAVAWLRFVQGLESLVSTSLMLALFTDANSEHSRRLRVDSDMYWSFASDNRIFENSIVSWLLLALRQVRSTSVSLLARVSDQNV